MNQLIHPIIYEKGIVYLDDIILWADTLEEMEENLKFICDTMAEAGLKLNGEKSNFLTKRLEILGHWVEAGYLKPDSDKLRWIKVECNSVSEVRSLLGALSYFRKFVPKFSTVMKPVNDLLSCKEVVWTEEHTKAVHKVMDHLEKDCLLKLPNYDKPFYVATDYSGVGIGAVLM
jgi:hypothetical protein